MSPDQPSLPPDPPDVRPADAVILESATHPTVDPRDAVDEAVPPAVSPDVSPDVSTAVPPTPRVREDAHPGASVVPPADSPPAEPRRADGARVWRVVRRPRWHERPDAHAPRRDVYYWLSTRRAASRTSPVSRPTSPDPHAR